MQKRGEYEIFYDEQILDENFEVYIFQWSIWFYFSTPTLIPKAKNVRERIVSFDLPKPFSKFSRQQQKKLKATKACNAE